MSKGKFLRGGIVLALLFAGLLVTVPSAQALVGTETFLFTSNHITGGDDATVPFGEVVLTQSGSNVDVTVSLFNGNKFMNSGAAGGENFLFNASGVALTDLSGSGLTFDGAGSGTFTLHADGTGFFDFGVVFTGQGTGGVNALPGPINFEVANAVISDLTIANAKGQLFAADIILGSGNTNNNGASIGKTGDVDVSGTTKVPEPTTMLLLGFSLISVVGVRRMLKN